MTVTARDLHSWIGTEVLDSAGEKVGKLEELYFRDDEPLAAGVRSGLAGRKHHAAALLHATVTRDSLQLGVAGDAVVATSDAHRIEVGELAALAAYDRRLEGVAPGELESWTDREQRLREQAQAAADAEKLQAEAERRADDEHAAATHARDAEHAAEAARRAREDAEARAEVAREDAGIR